jgi:hypothetical protein
MLSVVDKIDWSGDEIDSCEVFVSWAVLVLKWSVLVLTGLMILCRF